MGSSGVPGKVASPHQADALPSPPLSKEIRSNEETEKKLSARKAHEQRMVDISQAAFNNDAQTLAQENARKIPWYLAKRMEKRRAKYGQ